MDEMNTAHTAEIMVDAETLNTLPLAHVFKATGPARVVAENVTCGPVEVFDKPGEEWWLVRIEGRVDVLKPTEVEALEASEPQVLRYLWRLAGRRSRAAAVAEENAKRAARIAACAGHEWTSIEIGRCLHSIVCRHCGAGEVVSSDG